MEKFVRTKAIATVHSNFSESCLLPLPDNNFSANRTL